MGNEQKENKIISLELLRIVSMIMIVCLHFITYCNINDRIELFSYNFFLREIIHSMCLISVNSFVLISGFFCMKSKFRMSKLFLLIFEVFFYSILIYLLFVSINKVQFSLSGFLYSFFPSLTRQYWFITSYIGVYCFSPILKIICSKIDRNDMKKVLIVGFVAFVLYYNLFFFCDNLNFGGATGIVWFIYLYFWGIYIFKYYKVSDEPKKWLVRFLLIQLIALSSYIPFYLLYVFTKNSSFIVGASIFNSVYNSIFPFIGSILFFMFFLNIKNTSLYKFKNIIYLFSSSSLACYLIHENKYIRNVLWNNNIFAQLNINLYIIALLFVPVIIFVLCVMIDKIRTFIFKILFNDNIVKRINNTQFNIEKKCEKLEERIL